jgi:ABC-type sugar transport system permease subunit
MSSALAARLRRNRHFYLFVSPFFILFAIFGLYPILFSLYLSLVKWNGLTAPQFVGLANFRKLFADPAFYRCISNTILIGLIYIPPMFIGAFLLAVLLNQQAIKFRALFRAAAFVPCITPTVVIAIVFLVLFGTKQGLINFGLRWIATHVGLHFSDVQWLDSERLSKLSVSILLVWRWTGYNAVLMLAGLQGIPEELYEAATIDGASRARRLWHITLPLLNPTIIFCSVTSLIGTVYMFDEPFVLTQGGPGDSSTNFGVYLFNEGFTDFRFGFASAAAYSVAVVVFVMSLMLVRSGKKRAA